MAVELRKNQKISLEKKSDSMGEILINLNWNPSEASGGLFKKAASLDLDLGCLFELKNGRKSCVQALGNAFGSLTSEPYIALDGDDRSGECATGENLRINGNMISQIKRVLVYTFIYEGAANWQQAKGIVTIKCPGNDDLIVRMDEYSTNLNMCALAMLENENDTFSVEKLITFFDGHVSMDRAYNWGLNWKPGKK